MMERSAFLRNLGSFIVKTDQSLKAIAEKLGWNAKKLADEETLVCPYNSGHRVPIRRSEVHEERCRLRSMGIDPDVEMSVKLEGSEFFYQKSKQVVTIKTG
ncbi:U11/U12 small nuclear ribonucleoprotein 48 kDa protein-like [Corticium candelabrum]|uniref:U11/U12 small nuclear ribonucleoprotein 48 kDa protein-like n=1 Tax=Corticium candelabrum TaxID=121492 RepID=UPI002E26ED08|nr:U11/U12 small nuclear ribonucleoprotein 48 kDa protein-like [Corticium candelabrum]